MKSSNNHQQQQRPRTYITPSDQHRGLALPGRSFWGGPRQYTPRPQANTSIPPPGWPYQRHNHHQGHQTHQVNTNVPPPGVIGNQVPPTNISAPGDSRNSINTFFIEATSKVCEAISNGLENPITYLSLVNLSFKKKGIPIIELPNSVLADSRKLYEQKNIVNPLTPNTSKNPSPPVTSPSSPFPQPPSISQPPLSPPPPPALPTEPSPNSPSLLKHTSSSNIHLSSNLATTPINKSPFTPQTQSNNPSTPSTHPPFQSITSDPHIFTIYSDQLPLKIRFPLTLTLNPNISTHPALTLHPYPSPLTHLLPIKVWNSDK